MKYFEEFNLNKAIQKALVDLDLRISTPIQESAFAPIMSGRDLIGIAQTGTGKTLAYLLPALQQWNFTSSRNPQILIIVPTRELVVQVVQEVEKLSSYQNLVVRGCYGGVNIRTQADELNLGLDVLVSTPGRLLDHILNGNLSVRDIKKLIIDEVDELFELGFRPQLQAILELLPEKKQSLIFSATLSEEIEELARKELIRPLKVEAAPAGTPLDQIEESYIRVPNFYTKIEFLKRFFEGSEASKKILLFVGSRKLADLVHQELMQNEALQIGIVHSSKSQNYRFNAVKDFKTGTSNILLATDLISRGIDIQEVSLVINLDVPDQAEIYLHRIGRTGRAQAAGKALTLISDFELERWEAVCDFTGSPKIEQRLPEYLPLRTELIPEEQPVQTMVLPDIKTPSRKDAGPAFHEKKAKNQKVNVRKNWKKIKQEKYGKPKKKGGKRR
ncbi:MAG: DEAD/DEAH box helicase [Bacteroidetes bacterium]|nr:MAG: DEAD/DEAH box helicase [Bacteroidota bacterium]